MFHCLLRWLGGGSYLDISLSAGISPDRFSFWIYKIMDAISEFEALAYKFPNTANELDEAAGFESMSSQAAIRGCVACLDGYLLQIKVPSTIEIGNVEAIFQNIIKNMEYMFRLHVITNVGLFKLRLLQLEEHMTLQHLKNNSVRWFKICHWEDLSLVTMQMFSLKLYSPHF